MTIKANNAWNKKPVYFNAFQAGLVSGNGLPYALGQSLAIINEMWASSLFFSCLSLTPAKLELLGALNTRCEGTQADFKHLADPKQ